MKMVMMIIDERKREELEVFLGRSGVEGYTEISSAVGAGTTEPRLGSSAFPRTSSVVFSVLDDTALERLKAGVQEFCANCGENLKMFAWDAEVVF